MQQHHSSMSRAYGALSDTPSWGGQEDAGVESRQTSVCSDGFQPRLTPDAQHYRLLSTAISMSQVLRHYPPLGAQGSRSHAEVWHSQEKPWRTDSRRRETRYCSRAEEERAWHTYPPVRRLIWPCQGMAFLTLHAEGQRQPVAARQCLVRHGPQQISGTLRRVSLAPWTVAPSAPQACP
jgi:hypothetical protein